MSLRLLLLAAVVSAVADEPYYSLSWPGPERGCSGVAGPRGQFSAECALPGGRVTLSADTAATYLKIVCEQDSTFSCEELQEARPLLAQHTAPHAGGDRTLERFEVKGCALPAAPLSCALPLARAADAKLLVLDDVRGAVTPRHVRGMTRVEKLRIYYRRGENETTMPYDVLAELPSLSSFSLKRGAVVLRGAGGLGAGGPAAGGPAAGGLPPLPALRMLELADGGLRGLPPGAFANAPGVETLGLWGNEIDDVDEQAFAGLTRLVNLSLNSNRLSSLPRALLRPCARLEHVDLYNNQLAALPEDLFRGLAHLREVFIFDNKAPLQLHGRVFADLPALQHLELKTCGLQRVPDHAFQNSTNLEQLLLSGNNLTSVPSGLFRGLAKLRILSLSGNRLEYLPEKLFWGLEMLENLDVAKNALVRLPEGVFAGLAALQVLRLGGNKIEALDRSVFNALSRLRELDLSGNRLQLLHSETFSPVAKLEILSLANNNLTISREVNTYHFISPEVNVRYQVNQTSVSADAYEYHSPLRELAHLSRLDLSRNRVALVCDDWRAFWNLARLDLAHNRLARLTDFDMDFMSEGITVDLTHNRIETFEPPRPAVSPADPALPALPAAPTFLLDHNPVACDCRLYPYVDMRERNLLPVNIVVGRTVCAQPPALGAVAVADLRPEQLVCDEPACPAACACVRRPARDRVEVSCAALPARLPELALPVHLRLRRPADLARLPAHVRYVDLSALNLTRAPTAAGPLEIDLTGNRLSAVPVDLLRLNCTLRLAGNPLDCGCDSRAALELLQLKRHLVRDYRNLTCGGSLLLSGVDAGALCAARDATVAGCAVALLGVLAAVLTAVAYRYKTEARILLRKFGLWAGDAEGGEGAGARRYDAFVSFSHEDARYVAEALVPRLEGGRAPLRLCLHYRDWVVGDFIPAQIARSVEESRRTIVVLSRAFLRSVWAQMEFRAAHGRERLLLLLLDPDLAADPGLDPELRAYLAVNTYVRADDPLVIDRLKDAVLSARGGFGRRGADKSADTGKDADKGAGLDVRLNARGQLVNGAFAA